MVFVWCAAMKLADYLKLARNSKIVYADLEEIAAAVPKFIEVNKQMQRDGKYATRLTELGQRFLTALYSELSEDQKKLIELKSEFVSSEKLEISQKAWNTWPNLLDLEVGQSVWRPLNFDAPYPINAVRAYLCRFKQKIAGTQYSNRIFAANYVDEKDVCGKGARVKRIK